MGDRGGLGTEDTGGDGRACGAVKGGVEGGGRRSRVLSVNLASLWHSIGIKRRTVSSSVHTI